MQKLLFAPQPTDLRPAITLTPAADEELDSYAREEEELLFTAWCAEVDATDPPF